MTFKIGDINSNIQLADIYLRTFYGSTKIDPQDIINCLESFIASGANINNITNNITTNVYTQLSNNINISGNNCANITIQDIMEQNDSYISIVNTIQNNLKNNSSASSTFGMIKQSIIQNINNNEPPIDYLSSIINLNLPIMNEYYKNNTDINTLTNTLITNAVNLNSAVAQISIDPSLYLITPQSISSQDPIQTFLGISNALILGSESSFPGPTTNSKYNPNNTTSGDRSSTSSYSNLFNNILNVINVNATFNESNYLQIAQNVCSNSLVVSNLSQVNILCLKINNAITNSIINNSSTTNQCPTTVNYYSPIQCIISNSLGIIFTSLYQNQVSDYNMNASQVGKSISTSDFAKYAKAFDARLDVLCAIETSTYYALCASQDLNIKCTILARFKQLGANVSAEMTGCGASVPIPSNPRVWPPNSFFNILFRPPILYYTIGSSVVIIVLIILLLLKL